MTARSRRLVRRVSAIAAVAVAGMVVVYAAFPGVLLRGAFAMQRASLDFTRRELALPEGTVVYLEGGSGPPLVLLHGFAGHKDSWLPFAGRLTERYRVIIPDLPGFGETTLDAAGDYRPPVQGGRVLRFLEALDAGKVHLVGWSMGGHIAGHLAHEHPEAVRSLVLLASGGIATDSATPMWTEVLAGRRTMIVSNRDELDAALTKVLEIRDPVPDVLKRAILHDARRRRATWDSVTAQVLAPDSRSSLDAVAPEIGVPTLVLWGEGDVLLHVAMGRRLAARIPEGTFVVLPACGHACPISQPDATLEVMLRFFGGH